MGVVFSSTYDEFLNEPTEDYNLTDPFNMTSLNETFQVGQTFCGWMLCWEEQYTGLIWTQFMNKESQLLIKSENKET